MVNIISSSGKKVNIEISGIAEIKRNLEAKTKQLITGVDLGLLRVTNFMQNEIKESIIGNRAEKKSVNTGLFANSIAVSKKEVGKYVVYVEKNKYPNTNTDAGQVSIFLEYGTSKIAPRRHFRNSIARNKKKVLDEIKNLNKF